jgi:hypothetical protein
MRTVLILLVAAIAALAALQPCRAEDKAEKERRERLEKLLAELEPALEKEAWAVKTKQTIAELKKELARAERIDVFRINPKPPPEGNTEAKKEFHGYEVLRGPGRCGRQTQGVGDFPGQDTPLE